jgi:hypothetical protein
MSAVGIDIKKINMLCCGRECGEEKRKTQGKKEQNEGKAHKFYEKRGEVGRKYL